MMKFARKAFSSINVNSAPPINTAQNTSNPTVIEIKPMMNPEMKIKSNLYKRKFPSNLTAFSSLKGQKLLRDSMAQGNSAGFFQTMEQFQTQGHPSYCGPSTMVVNFNSLGIDPTIRWKGPWRWYSEEVISCLSIENIPKFGMTIEEYSSIAKCNGVFNEIFRPDQDVERTTNEMLKSLELRRIGISSLERTGVVDEIVDLEYSKIIQHKNVCNCKAEKSVRVKKADIDLFEAAVMACCRRENINLILNNSRKTLKQTAYENISNTILLLDVARFKYFSFWVDLKCVWDSFFPLDTVIKKPRGFLLTSRFHKYSDIIIKLGSRDLP